MNELQIHIFPLSPHNHKIKPSLSEQGRLPYFYFISSLSHILPTQPNLTQLSQMAQA